LNAAARGVTSNSMSRIHITREHALGLAQARRLAARWGEAAEEHLGMHCHYEEAQHGDRLLFERPGVRGQLTVSASQFVIDAKLGLLLGAFRHRIEADIVRKLDQLLAHDEPLAAFDDALARRAARRSGSSREA
jgi:putative polyhydroxyalkanoate system protein